MIEDLNTPFGHLMFVITKTNEVLDRLASRGTCLTGELIELAHEMHRRAHQVHAAGDGPAPASIGDRVIWRNNSVVALIRPLADGTLAVIRFPASGYPVALDASEIGGGV